MPLKRIGVLVSGSGSNMQAIMDGIRSGDIPGEMAVVIADKPGVYALERARRADIPTVVVDKKSFDDTTEFNDNILQALALHRVDLVVLAGYLTKVGEGIIRQYPNAIINIHPALIPSFCGKGFYGRRVHQAAIDYGVKISGATVHFVDEGMDTGPVILQQSVPVYADDDAQSLAARVLQVEHKILPQAVGMWCSGGIRVEGRKVWTEQVEE